MDYCRALAAAIFDDPSKVMFISLTGKERFPALNDGTVDILSRNSNFFCVDKSDGNRTHASWLFTLISEEKDRIQKRLREKKIESNQVHFRNDKYSIFKKFVGGKSFPNMDYVEDKYLVLPNHHKISVNKAKYIAQTIDNLL